MSLVRSPRLLVLWLIAALLLAACSGGGATPAVPTATLQESAPTNTAAPAATNTTEPEPTATAAPTEVTSTLEDAQAATVQVLVQGSQFLEEFIGSGSGVVYDASGLILTNNHVVEGAAIVQVQFEGAESPVSARVLGKSPCDDLAVIKVDRGDLPVATLGGESDIRIGDDVFAIGYPLGEPHQGTTKGIASKLNIAVPTDFADYLDAIQTDAAINPGNSGGPLTTRDGKVIGINSAGMDSAQGTNFAISIDYARPIMERLAAGENISWIGVNAAPLPADLAESYGIAVEPGLFVYAVDSGSPADDIGIEEGDFITSIEGISVGADGTLKAYCDVLRSHDNDDVLDVSVIRGGARFAGQVNGRELEGGETLALGEGTTDEGGSTDDSGGDTLSDVTFIDVSDDTGRITLQLPDLWAYATGELVIQASADLDGWMASFGGSGEGDATTPGFYINALDYEEAVDMTTVEDFLNNQTGVPGNCTFDVEGRDDYDDGVYQGRYDILACDQGEYVSLVAFDPAQPSFLIWIEAYLISDQDIDLFSNALDTFFVNP